jgi:hypothetical protein
MTHKYELKGKDRLEHFRIDGTIILEWILQT